MNDGPTATSHGRRDHSGSGPGDGPPSSEAIGELAPVPFAEPAPASDPSLAYETQRTRSADRRAARLARATAVAPVGLTLAVVAFALASAGVSANGRHRPALADGLMWWAGALAIFGTVTSAVGYDRVGGKIGLALAVCALLILNFLGSR